MTIEEVAGFCGGRSEVQEKARAGTRAKGPTAGGRSTDTSSIDPMNPFKLWVQFAERWQKASADAMSFWAETRKSRHTGGRKGRRRARLASDNCDVFSCAVDLSRLWLNRHGHI
jgi:hypothetical protein